MPLLVPSCLFIPSFADLSTTDLTIVIFKLREVLLAANMSPIASRGELTSSFISLVFINHVTDFAEKEGLLVVYVLGSYQFILTCNNKQHLWFPLNLKRSDHLPT